MPAEFGQRGTCDGAAERAGQQLTAETHPEHPHTRGQRASHHRDLAGHPAVGQPVVVDRPARPQRHDRVVVEGIGEGDVHCGVLAPVGRHDLESVDLETRFGERLAEQGLRRRGVVVEEQHLAGHGFTVRPQTVAPVG